MHLFRWLRFLSSKRRHSASPRRSSRSFLRHLYRLSGHRPSVGPPSDVRPSLIHIDRATSEDRRRRPALESTTRRSLTSASTTRRLDVDVGGHQFVGDRQFIQEFNRQNRQPASTLPSEARASAANAAAIGRVSSMFKPARRSTIMERASIINLFNELQFELPPLDPDTGQSFSDDSVQSSPTSPARASSRKHHKSKKKRSKKKDDAFDFESFIVDQPESKEMSRFRQYLKRVASMKSTTTGLDEQVKFRPVSGVQHEVYLEQYRSSLDGVLPPRSSTNGSRDDEEFEPIQFLFFGGSSEENPHKLREVDGESRRFRARYVAEQPNPSVTTSIPIKPSLVCNLPPVFEPRFAYASVYM